MKSTVSVPSPDVSQLNQAEFAQLAESHRRELQVHCYRMLGSLQDAEDLVQETLLKAWQKRNSYEGRAPFRAWLYGIATNACLDALARRPRRVLPPARQPASDPTQPPAPPIAEPIWLEPIPDEMTAGIESSPEARYETRESISLAFLAALQFLPARQRAVLVLRDVLDMPASQVADVLGTSVPSVNSILHRARAALEQRGVARRRESMRALPPEQPLRELLTRYVRAWENADVDALVSLLKQDATFPMPPMPQWFQGRDAIAAFVANAIFAGDARGRFRLLPAQANGQPAFAFYKLDDAGEAFIAFAIQVLTLEGNLIADVTTFATADLFKYFGFETTIAR